jgi:AraC-like DNA-binding protein
MWRENIHSGHCMGPLITPVYLLHPDPALRDRLRAAPAHATCIVPVADWRGLRDALRRAPLGAVAVVDPVGPRGGLAEEIRDLLRALPSAVVIAALPVGPGDGPTIRTLLAWGVADILDLVREDTPVAMLRRLVLVRGRAADRLLQRALPGSVPSRARALLTTAAHVVVAGGQGPEFARALAVDERTVPRWCARADLPTPRRLLAWLRLLLAADLLDDHGRTLESAARAAGYTAAVSLKSATKNLTGLHPRELRAQGAFEVVATAFSRELFQIREAARAAGRPAKDWLH